MDDDPHLEFAPSAARHRIDRDRVRYVKTKSGRVLSPDDIERLAGRAEQGFKLSRWAPRRGRPRLDPEGTGHSPRITARVSPSLYERATDRAASEGRTMSEVVRDLLEDYAAKPHRERGR